MKNPIQPLSKDEHGVLRFKGNAIVRHLLDWAQPRGMGMNELARIDFSQDDREQFAQLIGYSLDGFSELSYVSDATYSVAVGMADDDDLQAKDARIAVLEHELATLRDSLRAPIARLYGIHPDDLKGTA